MGEVDLRIPQAGKYHDEERQPFQPNSLDRGVRSERALPNPVRHAMCILESRTGFSLSWPVIPLPVLTCRLGRRRQKSPSRCIFSADDLWIC